MRHKIFVGLLVVCFFTSYEVNAQDRFLTVASTTSTRDSGLLNYLLPQFLEESGIHVRVVSVGTGKAIKMAERGDADVLLVHHRPSEEKFIAKGFGVRRFDLMYNDYVIIGPSADPAGVADNQVDHQSVVDALQKIVASRSAFVSRGDDSGTHKKELGLWNEAGFDAAGRDVGWYFETGSGMGVTLNIASAKGAYALADRATWIKFANKGDLVLLVEQEPLLFNQYGVMLVNPDKHPHVKVDDGALFIDWLLSDVGQGLIDAYRIAGQQAFFANAKRAAE